MVQDLALCKGLQSYLISELAFLDVNVGSTLKNREMSQKQGSAQVNTQQIMSFTRS